MSKKNTTHFVLDTKAPPKATKATLKKLDALKDDTIDYGDIPELDSRFWANVRLLKPSQKEMISLRLDKEILDYFRKQGKGYQRQMNAVLRAFIESDKRV